MAHSTAASSVTHFSGFDVEHKDGAEQRATGRNRGAALCAQNGREGSVFQLRARARPQRTALLSMGLQKYSAVFGERRKLLHSGWMWVLDLGFLGLKLFQQCDFAAGYCNGGPWSLVRRMEMAVPAWQDCKG